MSYVAVPVIGAIVCAYLLSQLDSNAITLGLSWLVLGIVVLDGPVAKSSPAPPGATASRWWRGFGSCFRCSGSGGCSQD